MVLTRAVHSSVVLVLSSMLAAGCQQTAPGGDDGDGGQMLTEVPVGEGELGSYFPLVDGGRWVYDAVTIGGDPIATEIVESSVVDFNGGEAFVFVDNPDENGVWTESTIARIETSAYRVHKEVMTDAGPRTIVDYDPGFTRFDDGWMTTGVKGERRYERTETKPAQPELPPDVEPRGHTFTVVAVDEVVTVPAGTFECVAVERIRTTGASAGERVLLWYAAGVGKVREERPATDRVEELSELVIPGGATLP